MERIEGRAHRPDAALFRIPAQRQLDEGAAGGAVQIRAGVVAGADDVIDFQLFDILFLAAEADLPAALVEGAVAADHGVVGVGEGVVELVAFGVILHHVGGGGAIEGAAHAGLAIGLRDLGMAGGADARVDVVAIGGGGTGRERHHQPDRAHGFTGNPLPIEDRSLTVAALFGGVNVGEGCVGIGRKFAAHETTAKSGTGCCNRRSTRAGRGWAEWGARRRRFAGARKIRGAT